MPSTSQHIWAQEQHRFAAEPVKHGVQLEALCHRRRRGPYSGTGSVLRQIVPELMARKVAMVATRSTEITAIAPELIPHIPLAPQTLTNLAEPRERTRFYPDDRTQRLAHGITELLLDWANVCHPEGVTIIFRELDNADPTDLELVATLLRRCDADRLTVVAEMNDVDGESALGAAITAYAERVPIRPRPTTDPPAGADLAQLYIDSDCLDTHPALRVAYFALGQQERERRHTARAEQLAARGEPSLELGAILYHLERGVDPAGAGGRAFARSIERCSGLGFYEAELDLCVRALSFVTLADQPALHCGIIHKKAACYAYMNRVDLSIEPLAQLRRFSIDAVIHMNTDYTMAMLYTRLLPEDRKDEDLALEWINAAIAIADVITDPNRRVFSQAFMRNGKALVELHRGNIQAALSLVDEAIELTDNGLEPGDHRLHRSVLRHNRSQVMAAIGDYPAAVADIGSAIESDPDYCDYYFDRAAMHRNAGQYEAALVDYATAIRLSPPFYEAHYNRADMLREMGQDETALADLDYVLELNPDHIDALLNRAGVLLSLDEPERARADIDHGLLLDPQNAGLLCAQGQRLAEAGDADAARASYTCALEQDPELVAAWANRAVLSYSTGHPAEAVRDLDRALGLVDDPALRSNRAIALHDLGEHHRAIEDLDAAVSIDDDPELLYWRGRSRLAIHDNDGATADWRAHLTAYGPAGRSPYVEEIFRLMPDIRQRSMM